MLNVAESGSPRIIQGGMGVGVSGWRLASAVARRGHLGVVSGTGLDQVVARFIQLGDHQGNIRRALAHFPCQRSAQRYLETYFIPGGKAPEAPFRMPGMFGIDPPRELAATVVISNFVEVWLAKEGHNGPVGLNLLDKIQLPNLASLYGAMLAGVDYVLMGAGIPWQIPGALDRFSRGEAASMKVTLEDDPEGTGGEMSFDPAAVLDIQPAPLKRPKFLAIISATPVAQALLKRATGKVDGFVVEGYTAGGHNAPPRGQLRLNERGEPLYGERDVPDIEKLKSLGVPFWLAGGMGRPGKLAEAMALGAEGIQVGTAFAFCRESAITEDLRRRVMEAVAQGTVRVYTDPKASPTGFPFKVVELEGTVADHSVYDNRDRVCDAGYLRRPYRKPDGGIGYRCPGEPEKTYVAKGGVPGETDGRMCLCNGLVATIGLAQRRAGGTIEEPVLLTAGDDLPMVGEFLRPGETSYSADDVLDRLLSAVTV